MSASLGACGGSGDNLYQTGIATVTWTPDGLGGGVLSVSVPKGLQCVIPPISGTPPQDWYVTLNLLRPRGGRRYRFTVAGKGNSYFSGGTSIGIAGLLFMFSPGSTHFCGPALDLVATTGTNPIEVTTSCCGGAGLGVTAYGYSTGSDAYSFTVTVEAL